MVYNLEIAIKRKFVECEQEGFQKGIEEARIAIAKKMLQMGWSIEEIVEIIELNQKQLEEIRFEINC